MHLNKMETPMRKLIETCPTCTSAALAITEVTCDACGTQVRSRYRRCPFCALSDEEQAFLLLFVRSRGNLKDLEKTLGVSYPTVRAKLDELVDRLAPPAAVPANVPDPRQTVLAKVQAGELSAVEALAWLSREQKA
jgi:hypothetical protein